MLTLKHGGITLRSLVSSLQEEKYLLRNSNRLARNWTGDIMRTFLQNTLEGYPTAPLVIWERSAGEGVIMDGDERCRTLLDLFSGEFMFWLRFSQRPCSYYPDGNNLPRDGLSLHRLLAESSLKERQEDLLRNYGEYGRVLSNKLGNIIDNFLSYPFLIRKCVCTTSGEALDIVHKLNLQHRGIRSF